MTTTESQPVTEPRPIGGEDDWSRRENLAEALIPLVGRLFRQHGVITAIYGRSLVNKSARKILKLHRFARHIDGTVLPIAQTLAIVEALDRLPLSPATIDIGELHRLHQDATGHVLGGLPPRTARLDPRHRRPAGHDRRRPLRLRPHRPAPGQADDREPRRPQRATATRHRGPHRRPRRPRQTSQPATPRHRARRLRRQHHRRPRQQHHHRQRHRHRRHQRRRPGHDRLHRLRHPARPAGRQHRPLARRRRPRPAPRLPRHRQSPADRARQGRPQEHRLRRQPELAHRARTESSPPHPAPPTPSPRSSKRSTTSSGWYTATSRPCTPSPTTRT